ncbi:MAG: ATPase (AAA+ superfamily)-like protein [Methanolobus sp. T82-4]|nr:MAG: ATPase (AAA+ superfamily)-like protein [Methanolobus sp. T82-4]
MAMTNHERVGKSLDLLKAGLGPFAQREMENTFGKQARQEAGRILGDDWLVSDKSIEEMDAGALLKLMWDTWKDVFRQVLGFSERTLVSELRDVRNKWAHQERFSSDDTDRALDSVERMLISVSAPEAEEVRKMKMELRRLVFDEQARSERRKTSSTVVQSSSNLKPWREIITPHRDVASGRYQQAEFAADLWQVHLGEGSAEYRDPVEFFRRTYLTESLTHLLVNAVQRIAGVGGDPVVQLQTNFGGGKTHSMLALYHLFSSNAEATELLGIEGVLTKAEVPKLPKAKTVVLVGNKISPGNPMTKPDGTVINTLWGEMAWQLGGKEAYERIRQDDEKATSPGDALRSLFNDYGPCVILIDEWVAYARQLHEHSDLPGGGFETQFSFAQALTESAKLANNCLLVISLPASDTATSPHAQVDDVEVGGHRGREALDRLRNVIGRVEAVWRPATAEEGFEIVRRRLFEPMTDPNQFKDRDVVARAFVDLYRAHDQEFPLECRDNEYEKRILAAYPIHPEVFDRLYTEWSTLVKFQRTRGVLRLMAAVIYSLWEKGDKNPLILPANIPIEDQRVKFELTRYLSDNWVPIIEKDVDGPNSLPLHIDNEVPNLGKFAACRRVARTIYLGSAPTNNAANRGLEDKNVKLGCVIPGESPAIFGDALRRLAGAATYLYQDGTRYWYSTQATVTKLAEDRAEQLKRGQDIVFLELEKRLRADLRNLGSFKSVHVLPGSSGDVMDDFDSKLVVLGIEQTYSKEDGNAAEKAAKMILETKGNSPRMYRNTLVFLAADKTRLQDLDEAIRKYIAWESIIGEKEELDLSPFQVKQATTQRDSANSTVNGRIPETYQWLLVPVQNTPKSPVEIQAIKLSGQDPLAVKASKKLQSEELLIAAFAGTRLKMELDKIPLWRGNHVAVKQLAEDFASYLYLQRFTGPVVLAKSIEAGLPILTWDPETFAYADSFDESEERYIGLRCGQAMRISEDSFSGLLVKPDVAAAQRQKDVPPKTDPITPSVDGTNISDGGTVTNQSPVQSFSGGIKEPQPFGTITNSSPAEPPKKKPKRYHGSVELDPARMGRDAGQIAEEVISHLSGLVGATVKVTLEIEADVQSGFSDRVVRIVTENGKALKFNIQGFEEE